MAARLTAAMKSQHAPSARTRCPAGARGPVTVTVAVGSLTPPHGTERNFLPKANFKMAVPLPTTPSTVRVAAVNRPPSCPPSLPPRQYLHSENLSRLPAAFTSRPQPSPVRPRPLEVPQAGRGANLTPLRCLPGHRAFTLQRPPPPITERTSAAAQGRQAPPRPNCGLLRACYVPCAAPPGPGRRPGHPTSVRPYNRGDAGTHRTGVRADGDGVGRCRPAFLWSTGPGSG